jgi:hypothetical protein
MNALVCIFLFLSFSLSLSLGVAFRVNLPCEQVRANSESLEFVVVILPSSSFSFLYDVNIPSSWLEIKQTWMYTRVSLAGYLIQELDASSVCFFFSSSSSYWSWWNSHESLLILLNSKIILSPFSWTTQGKTKRDRRETLKFAHATVYWFTWLFRSIDIDESISMIEHATINIFTWTFVRCWTHSVNIGAYDVDSRTCHFFFIHTDFVRFEPCSSIQLMNTCRSEVQRTSVR